MATINLPAKYLAILKQLLQTYAPHAEVWAYGSRVSSFAHATSDLDLVLRNPTNLTVPQQKLTELRAALSESKLPVLVDVMDWARLPQAFRDEIERTHSLLPDQ